MCVCKKMLFYICLHYIKRMKVIGVIAQTCQAPKIISNSYSTDTFFEYVGTLTNQTKRVDNYSFSKNRSYTNVFE